MIHLISSANASLYAPQLDAMHRLRWRIYVEERGWRELRQMQSQAGLERDAYDDERAHYLLAIDDSGAVIGGMRVRSTDDRSLLRDRFAHLVEDEAAILPSPMTWELTRLLRAPASRSHESFLRYSMNCALIEFCLSRGVRKLIATSETFLLPMTRKAWGTKLRPLGLPQPYAEGEVIAVELTPDRQALETMRAAGCVEHAQLYEHAAPSRLRAEDPLADARLIGALRSASSETLRRFEALTSRAMEMA